MSHREWFLNGNYLIIIVSVCIILPLAVMKQLGMFGFFSCPHILSFISHFLSCTLSQLWFFLILFYSLFFLSISLDFVLFISPQVTWATPVVFPSPAWCFSWFQWVLAKTLTPLQGVDPLINFCFLLCRWSTRNSTSRVPWMKSTATSRWTMSTLLLMVQTTSARPKCSPSTLRFGGFILIFFPCLSSSVCVCLWGALPTDLWCVLGFRRRTPSPFWPLLLSAILRFSPSTPSSESKFSIPIWLWDKNVLQVIDGT